MIREIDDWQNDIDQIKQFIDNELQGTLQIMVLFGSFAKNRALPTSDVDLLAVIKDFQLANGNDRSISPITGISGLSREYNIIGIDNEELKQMLRQGNVFYIEISATGKLVHGSNSIFDTYQKLTNEAIEKFGMKKIENGWKKTSI